jgi:hypothetical protein
MIDLAVADPEFSTRKSRHSPCTISKKIPGRSTPSWTDYKKNAKAPEPIDLETASQTSWPAVEAREKILKIVPRPSGL